MNNKWLSGMMGLVVGDALGVPVEFLEREEIRTRKGGLFEGPVKGMEYNGTFRMPIGTWSDDSSMAIATLFSILENNSSWPKGIMDNFVCWHDKGEFTPFGQAFDVGITCHVAIENYKSKGDVSSCGLNDEYSNGNGSLMRIMPVCLYYYYKQGQSKQDNLSDIISGIDAVSGLTHSHLRSKIACGLYYFMIKSILDHENESDLLKVLQKGIDDGRKFYDENLEDATELFAYNRIMDLLKFKSVPEEHITSSGYVVASLEAALWCLINTGSYEECLLKAVNLGKDTDTVAAIAGGLAGLFYGYEGIPSDWVNVIQRREWLEELCNTADEYY